MAELAYTETNFLGRGQYVRLSVSDGQYSQGWKASFTEPYFLGQRLAAGFDLYHQVNNQNQYALYENWTTGGTLRLGIPVTDDLTFQPNYALYQSKITITNTSSQPYDDCSGPNSPWIVGGTFYAVTPTPFVNCLTNGEAPVEIKQAAAQGAVVTSLVGFSLSYNTLDDRKDPTSGWVATYKQDFAGVGGQSDFIRETFDARWYHPITDDFIGLIHLQAGQINGFGSQAARHHQQLHDGAVAGSRLCAGRHRASRHRRARTTSRPRDRRHDLLRRVGRSRIPDLRPAEGNRAQGRAVRRRGQPDRLRRADQLLELPGLYLLPARSERVPITQPSCANVWDPNLIRSAVGASLIWASPHGSDPVRFRLPAFEGQVRPDPDLQLLRRRDLLASVQPSLENAGASQADAPVVAFDGTPRLAKIRFFPQSSAPTLGRSRGLVRRGPGAGIGRGAASSTTSPRSTRRGRAT